MRPRPTGLIGLCLALVVSWPLHAQAIAVANASASRVAATELPRLALIVDTAKRELDPGTSTTLRVVVQDLIARDQDFTLRTTLPAGWRLLSGTERMHVVARARAIHLVQVSIPSDAGAGEYHVVHAVRAVGLDADIEARTTIIVRARRSLTVALLDEPYFAATGSKFRATFLVTNHGNVRTRVHLHARTQSDVSAKIDTLTWLQPGESRRVSVVADAGASSNSAEVESRNHVTLVADAEGGLSGDGKPVNEAVANVRVVPGSSDAGLPWHALPVLLSVSNTQTYAGRVPMSERSRSFELATTGQLTEGSGTTIDLFARGPRPDYSIFGERDEYRVSLATATSAITAGDQIFSMTPLSDGGSVTSGLSGKIQRGAWSAGGLAGHDRRIPNGTSEGAAFVGYDPSAQLHISGNLVERTGYAGGTVFTAYARLMPTSRTIVELEQGADVVGPRAGATANLIRAAGDHGWIAFDLRRRSADSAYRGGGHGNGQDLASVTLRPSRWLRLSGRANEQTIYSGRVFNFANQPPDPPSVIRSSEAAMEVAGLVAGGLREYSATGGAVGLPGVSSGLLERSSWVRVGRSLGPLSAAAAAERGTSSDRSGGPAHDFSTRSAQTALRVTSHSTFAVFVEAADGQRGNMPSPRRLVSTGASAQLQFGGLSLGVSGTSAPGVAVRAPNDSLGLGPAPTKWVDGLMSYRLPLGQSISLRVRAMRMAVSQAVMTTAKLAYSMPLHLPVSRSRSQARVLGRVYDGETGAGISNALVRVGDRIALTDEQGRAAFGGIAPGRYPVFVDLGGRQFDGTGLEDPDVAVAARAGRTTEIGVRVSKMGKITGTISLFERTSSVFQVPGVRADTLGLQRTRGLGGVVISMMNGSEERRVVTDAEGSFELSDARAGLWRIVIPSSNLPAEHYVERDSVRIVDLAAGAKQSIEIRVLPRQRKVLSLDVAPSQAVVIPPSATPPAIDLGAIVAPAPVSAPSATSLVVARPAVAQVEAIAPRRRAAVSTRPVSRRVVLPAALRTPSLLDRVLASAHWPFLGRRPIGW